MTNPYRLQQAMCYDKDRHEWNTHVVVVPGSQTTTHNHGKASWSYLRTWPAWMNNGDYDGTGVFSRPAFIPRGAWLGYNDMTASLLRTHQHRATLRPFLVNGCMYNWSGRLTHMANVNVLQITTPHGGQAEVGIL